jgi:enamine deaminase RidA (YjgF/YER057c/UK114 family)
MKTILFSICLLLSNVIYAQSSSNIKFINPDNLSKSPAYSHIGEVSGGKIIFISGQVSNDSLGNVIGKGDIKLQTEQVYKNLEKALKAVGATFGNVVKFGIYLKDMSKIAEFREVRNRLFDTKYYKNQPNRPVSTAIGVVELFHPDWLLEIEATVVLNK